jgi:DNA-binding GntR family transcriptional regulator
MKLREKAYQSFTRHLLAMDIRPGQFITQREMVALTGLTLGAIREMIPRLEALGLIVTVPQRGMQIAHVDLKLVRNAFQFRGILEREAVAAFTRRASADDVAALAEELAQIRRKAERGVTRAVLEEAQAVDWGFHDALIDAMGNEIISDVYRVNSIKIRLIRLERVVLSPETLFPAMDEHARIMAAIERRDVAGAIEAMDRHVASAQARAMGIGVAAVAPSEMPPEIPPGAQADAAPADTGEPPQRAARRRPS